MLKMLQQTDVDALVYAMVLQHKSLVHHSIEVLKVTDHSIGQSIIETIQEILLLFLISVHLIGSIAKHLGKLGDILIHRHGSLLQILEFLLLKLDQTLGNMVRTESGSKLRPVDTLRFLMSFYVSTPLISCRS
jgi:hypothetical protein